MLTIPKKAATEAECEAILTASLNVRNPFGVPTLILDTADFANSPKGFLKNLFTGSVASRIQRQIVSALKYQQVQDPDLGNFEITDIFQTHNPGSLAKFCAKTIEEENATPGTFLTGSRPNYSPRINIVFTKPTQDIARLHASLSTAVQQNSFPPLPGFDAHHKMYALWHEIAHGLVVENEYAADLISAIVCRHAFEDCSFLKARADMRAANAVLSLKNYAAQPNNHTWACVEALDSVAAIDEIPAIGDLRDIGNAAVKMKQNFREKSIAAVGHKFQSLLSHTQGRYLQRITLASQYVLASGNFASAEEKMVAKRFALAMQRLSTGTSLYQDLSPNN